MEEGAAEQMNKAAIRHVCVLPQDTAHVNYGDIAQLVAEARYPRQPGGDEDEARDATMSLVAARDGFRKDIRRNWLPRALHAGLITPLDTQLAPHRHRAGGPAADDRVALDEFVAFAAAHGVVVAIEGATPPHTYAPGSVAQVDYLAAWWDAQVGARVLWEAESITAQQAAMALCGVSPLDTAPGDVAQESWYIAMTPQDYKALLLAFAATENAEPNLRTFADWLAVARAKPVKYHPWIEAWLTATGKIAPTIPLPSGAAAATNPQHAEQHVGAAADVEKAALRLGSNSKAAIDDYVERRAREIYRNGEASNNSAIAKIIHDELQARGYRSERTQPSVATIIKAIPAGLTGGRAKNGRKSSRA